MMKRGAKRPALSDSNPNSNPTDSTLRSKRVMDAPSFDVHRAESSHQGISPLDAKRVESARQHVRALNTQFASWVQLQLQNHPYELWEDGAKDYLSHASHILEKFKDVADWLRAEAAKLETTAAAGLPKEHNESVAILGDSRPSMKPEVNNGFAQETSSGLQSSALSKSHGSGLFTFSQPSGLSSSLNTGSFGINQTPANSSMQSSGPSNSQTSSIFGFSKTPASSSLQSSGPSNSQTSSILGFSQTPASSSLQSSSLASSQSSGLFSFSQTPASSSLQSSGLFNSQNSGFFSMNQKPASSSLQSSGLSSSQSSGFFGINQKPASSGLQSSGLSGSQSSGFFALNQTPVFGGTQSFSGPNVEASGNADEENEVEQPSSPSLKKTEEEGIAVVHEVKCKVYVKPDTPAEKAWKDMGVGQLSIKCKEGADKASKESKPTIIVRNDVGKILLNALIYSGIKTSIKKNTIASVFHTSDGVDANVVARTYLLRLKTEDDTTKLADAIQDYAPSA